MPDAWTRRQVVIGGVVFLLTGCAERSTSTSAAASARPRGPAIPPYDLGPAPQPAGLWYQVQVGDSLVGISERSGVSLEAIVTANQLASGDLTVGQQLWLPGALALAPTVPGSFPQEREPGQAPMHPGGYVLVRRSAWAVAPVRGNNVAMGSVTRITIHHTGEEPGLEGVPEIERLRRIEHYHQTSRHWAAIGYHYLVGRTGYVYEGRPVHYQGAHVSGQNEHNLGISVIGDFMTHLPEPAQLAALEHFLNDQRLRFQVGVHRVYGHRELGTSQCPGDRLYAWLRAYRARTA